MNLLSKVIPITLALVVSACGGSAIKPESTDVGGVVPPADKWKCSAKSLVGYSYSGGSQANIHLSAYSKGGNYPVTLNSDNTIATGKTADNTPFTCTKQ